MISGVISGPTFNFTDYDEDGDHEGGGDDENQTDDGLSGHSLLLDLFSFTKILSHF